MTRFLPRGIKSIDLKAATYQSAAKLNSKLTGYVDKVAKFNGANWGGKAIDADDIAVRGLEVAIPKGAASQMQRQVLNKVIKYGRTKGVTVKVVEVQ